MPENTNIRLSWDDIDDAIEELTTLARQLLIREEEAWTVQAIELVQSGLRRQNPRAWKSGNFTDVTWKNRNQLIGRVYRAMRQALIDYARKRKSSRRLPMVNLSQRDLRELSDHKENPPELLEEISPIMERMRKTHPQWVRALEYWSLDDLSQREIGVLMGVSERTVHGWIQRLRALILRELESPPDDSPA